MNRYLYYLGTNTSKIRQVLNLTQEDLAKLMGVSRPTIVKLEKEPDKMTRTLALALFGIVAIEIKKRLRNIKEINPADYKDIDKIGLLTEELKATSFLSIVNLGITVTKGLGGLVPGISTIISEGLKHGWKSLKGKGIDIIKDSVHWDAEQAKKVIESVEQQLLEDEKTLLEYFKLEAFDIELFGEELEKGEDENYDIWGD